MSTLRKIAAASTMPGGSGGSGTDGSGGSGGSGGPGDKPPSTIDPGKPPTPPRPARYCFDIPALERPKPRFGGWSMLPNTQQMPHIFTQLIPSPIYFVPNETYDLIGWWYYDVPRAPPLEDPAEPPPEEPADTPRYAFRFSEQEFSFDLTNPGDIVGVRYVEINGRYRSDGVLYTVVPNEETGGYRLCTLRMLDGDPLYPPSPLAPPPVIPSPSPAPDSNDGQNIDNFIFAALQSGTPTDPQPPAFPDPDPSHLELQNGFGWNASARSIESIPDNGYVSFKVPGSVVGVFVGFNTNDNSLSYEELSHAFYCSHGRYEIWESGEKVHPGGAYTSESTFVLERLYGQVRYHVL